MKKFLSMALALVMTLSLCTFVNTTKADAAFTDADQLSSQYAEQAADVIQEIEVMDGYDDGSFRPTAGLTRQAAAKIICNMILGPTTARSLPTNANPFPDVLAGNQFSGYISYCAQQGIISGYGDGTFRPGDPLSGYAYLKMLLGALGYDALHESFVGDNWKVNVAKIALGIGLNRGIEEELDGTTQVTRESAAIYAFNTLQADMVEYESKNTLEINGVKVSMGGGNAVPQTWGTSATQTDNINAMTDTGTGAGRPIVQFAERYFDKLRRQPNGDVDNNGRDEYTTDDFGRPSVKWFWKGVEVGTYSRDPDATFVGGVKVNKIYEALGMTSGCDSAYLYINSDLPNNVALDVSRSNDKDLDHANNLNMDRVNGSLTKGEVVANHYASITAAKAALTGPGAVNPPVGVDPIGHYVDRIGDGCIIECFLNDATNHVDVCVISVYGGKVDAVKGATAKKDAYVTINWGDHDTDKHYPLGIDGAPGRNEYETQDFEEDDVVAYIYSDSANEIKDMYLLSAESGALQSKVSGKSLRLDSTTYKYGKEYSFNEITEGQLSQKSTYVVYVDENDFVLWVEEDEFSVDNYALIESITLETSTGNQVVTSSLAQNLAVPAPFADDPADDPLEVTFKQVKDAANTSSESKAQIRYPTGTRRTVTLDDAKNYRTDLAGDVAGAKQLTNESGDGNGNWIAESFQAGKIVRVNSNSDGYRLHSIDGARQLPVYNFLLVNNQIGQRTGAGKFVGIDDGDGNTIQADSETHFVVDDLAQGSYKHYLGVKNAPDIGVNDDNTYAAGTTAYVYHIGKTAKLVFVTKANQVSSSSNDIVFLAATSLSDMIESDDGNYYEITAVEKNQIKTLTIRAGRNVSFYSNDAVFRPDLGGQDKAYNCVILNSVTYDSNDFITKGSFNGGDYRDNAFMAHGIRRVNSEEIRVDTATGKASLLKDISENIRVFFVDGSDIEQIDYSEIVNDPQDYVYYVQNSNGEVTYLFIVNYEPDNIVSTANITAANCQVNPGNGNNTYDAQSYVITPLGTTTIEEGGRFTFTVQDVTVPNAPVDIKGNTNAGMTLEVGYQYVDANNKLQWNWAAATDANNDGEWDSPTIGTKALPLATGTTIAFQMK